MPETFPPPNYIPVESQVDGIEVYKPAPPKQDPHKEVVDFKCPQCGAAIAYKIEEGGLTCTHCGYYEPSRDKVVGKRAQEFEFTVETMGLAARGWGEERSELECQSCGVKTSIPVRHRTHHCAYCGSNQVIQRESPQEVLRPRYIVPFEVDSEACRGYAVEWLGSSWMTPGNLKKIARIANFTPIYIPYWTFDAITTALWEAEVGHAKTKRYYSDGKWKERVVIEWRWESGNVHIDHDDILIPGTGRLSDLHLDKVGNWDLRALVPYDPKFLAGLHAQAYDVKLEQAWELVRQKMREDTRLACRAQASTSRIRNFRMNLDFADETWRYVLLPLYLASYDYAGTTYQVMINGQDGGVSGPRPIDWRKVWLVIAAILAPGLFLSLVGIVTILLAGIGIVVGIIGFVLLLIGIVISIVIVQKALKLDDR